MLRQRAAITQTLAIVVVLVIVVAGVAGVYFFSSGPSKSGSNPIDISIIESDPVNQVDSFNPMNVTVQHDTTITLAVQNGDDEPRTFQISALNVNQTIGTGSTSRITFTVGQPGVFQMFLPATPPFGAYKASPSVTGYLIVT